MTICQERVQVIYQRGTRVRTHVNRSDADAVQLRAVRGDGTDAQIIWEVVQTGRRLRASAWDAGCKRSRHSQSRRSQSAPGRRRQVLN